MLLHVSCFVHSFSVKWTWLDENRFCPWTERLNFTTTNFLEPKKGPKSLQIFKLAWISFGLTLWQNRLRWHHYRKRNLLSGSTHCQNFDRIRLVLFWPCMKRSWPRNWAKWQNCNVGWWYDFFFWIDIPTVILKML